jgi:hypothetical protein
MVQGVGALGSAGRLGPYSAGCLGRFAVQGIKGLGLPNFEP